MKMGISVQVPLTLQKFTEKGINILITIDDQSNPKGANRITLNPLGVESIKESYAHIFRKQATRLTRQHFLHDKTDKGFIYAFPATWLPGLAGISQEVN